MAADFFQQQDHARRNTGRLIVLFGLAVLAIIASIEVLLAATMGYVSRDPRTGAVDWSAVTDPQLILVAVAGTLIVVGGGSLYKIAALRGGGHVVAEGLGGRLLTGGGSDATEQRLLNVVEEMAIASGTPTPPVYLLDQEEGINAFAAGFAPEDAVIGVTRGAATRLSRDELQGVMAHEFSHILNGDMRLNIRLMGLLHGILIIGMLGYFVLRMSFYSGRGRRSKDSSGVAILALGAGLAAIGFAGTFFGNLIKAAVSRQREFLADASAVQFTRHPSGLAGALKKIGGFSGGAAIQHPSAPEASHMFFGRATSGMSAMFSTHPPLVERIRRIDPSWDGEFEVAAVTRPDEAGVPSPVPAGAMGLAGAVAAVGRPGVAHLRYAETLIGSLPEALKAAARDGYGARAVVYALLLDRDDEIRARQLAHLGQAANPIVLVETHRLAALVEPLPARMRLPLLEMSLSALRSISETQRDQFVRNVEVLVQADSKIDLFEWVLHRILLRSLDDHGGRPRAAGVRHHSVASVRPQCELLLSTVAHAGARAGGDASRAFEQGRVVLGLEGATLRARGACGLDDLDAALEELDETAPSVKRRILEAAVACITADRQVTSGEAELLRAVSASMSCPMPPILLGEFGGSGDPA